MIEKKRAALSVSHQCRLLSLNRSSLYIKPVGETEENLRICALLDRQYYVTPFYGSRRLKAWLSTQGYQVNRKRMRRLLKQVGWKTLYAAIRTTRPDKSHRVYPYLLKGLRVDHVNQVWETDITYIPMSHGFMYLCAVIDVYSRYIVGWGISNTMSGEWCAEVMETAISNHGDPAIVNCDQGSQFTSEVFTGMLKDHGIRISMDTRGRALDDIYIERFWRNIKYEEIYLHPYDNGLDLYKGVAGYMNFYNGQRLHQSLGYRPPKIVYYSLAA